MFIVEIEWAPSWDSPSGMCSYKKTFAEAIEKSDEFANNRPGEKIEYIHILEVDNESGKNKKLVASFRTVR